MSPSVFNNLQDAIKKDVTLTMMFKNNKILIVYWIIHTSQTWWTYSDKDRSGRNSNPRSLNSRRPHEHTQRASKNKRLRTRINKYGRLYYEACEPKRKPSFSFGSAPVAVTISKKMKRTYRSLISTRLHWLTLAHLVIYKTKYQPTELC